MDNVGARTTRLVLGSLRVLGEIKEGSLSLGSDELERASLRVLVLESRRGDRKYLVEQATQTILISIMCTVRQIGNILMIHSMRALNEVPAASVP